MKYTNRKHRTYYLHQGQTKTGKPKYYMSMKEEGSLDMPIPEGYEIYENPSNAGVFLRRIPTQVIDDQEKAVVERGLRAFSDVDRYIVDVKQNAITIYLPIQDVDALLKLLDQSFPTRTKGYRERLLEEINFSSEMRFILVDKEKRIFETQRFCYLGSIDDWITIGAPGKLDKLVKEYVKHLGKDSYFELY